MEQSQLPATEPTSTSKKASLKNGKPSTKKPNGKANGSGKESLDKSTPFDLLNPRQFVLVKGAKVHNLKGLSVAIPRNKLVVITGLSGSGKSSLAFNTIFAEGQRMYVESLSAYARQFLTRMEKPEVEYIRGLSPAIAIEQKVTTRNARSTVGTATEVYDYLKLLFARIGITYSPMSGHPVRKDSVTDVTDYILGLPPGTRLHMMAPFVQDQFPAIKRKIEDELSIMLQKGFSRLVVDGEVKLIEDLQIDPTSLKDARLHVLIDRFVVPEAHTEEDQFRLGDSTSTAFFEGHGTCTIQIVGGQEHNERSFSDRFELDGITFEEPTANFFSFNNPYGACRTCDGFGKILGIDPDLVVPDKSLSIYEGALAPWRGDGMKEEFLKPLLKNGVKFDFPIHRAFAELTIGQIETLWKGNKYFNGLDYFFKMLSMQTHKIQYRVMLSRFRGRTACPDCRGTRLRKDAGYVKIDGRNIQDLVLLSVEDLILFFKQLNLSDYEKSVARQLLREITSRLEYLAEVGLSYLTMNRLANTLSGGEFQRIKLATSLGSALVGSLYVLDEPSIGLHPRDTQRLVKVLKHLRDIGNTVLVVEHEEEIMRAADQIIDIGPAAGNGGGKLIFQGHLEGNTVVESPEMKLALDLSSKEDRTDADSLENSHTLRFLTGKSRLPMPEVRRPWADHLLVRGARENNLRNVTVRFPLKAFTCVTGVSGSGKSTLVAKVLYPALARVLGLAVEESGKFDALEGDVRQVTQVEFIDQNPIGKSSRSNPVTFTKAWDLIRTLLSEQPLARQRGYKPSHYSFNVASGRCEACQGEGEVQVPMQFMADLYLECEACHGQRFMQEILEVDFQGKNAFQILAMTVDEAVAFFATKPRILDKIIPLQKVGLGYITLGQSSNTLSGGEAQRVKLASFLSKGGASGHVVFIFDEPTTGLHAHDVAKLLDSINALVDQGHTVIVIEHNMEMVRASDWVIDIGPDGGDHGGQIMFEGTPEQMVKSGEGETARFLKVSMK